MRNLLSRKWIYAGGVGMSAALLIGALLVTGVLPGTTRPAHAASAGGGVCDLSAQHSVCTGKATSAYTAFFSNDGCISTQVSVNAFQDVSHSATDPSADTTQIFVDFYQFDTCAFVDVASASGQVIGSNFQGDSQLNTAALNATVPLTGTGVPDGFTLTVSLNWRGYGDTRTFNNDFKYRSPSGITITRQVVTVRSAIATGTISDGTTNFASAPAIYSTLFDSQGGQIIVDRP